MMDKDSEQDAEAEEKWATENGIKFSIATLDDVEELREFMHKHFYPDEPISRCIELMNGNSFIDKMVLEFCDDLFLVNAIHKTNPVPGSIIARSTVDNCILGCRVGAVYTKEDIIRKDKVIPNWIGKLPKFIPIPRKIIHVVNAQALFDDLHYDKSFAFEELKDGGNSIYMGANLTVSHQARGKGLGTELVKRGYKIAKNAGCRYTYISATSLYSQNIFHKFGNTKVLHEVKCDDYKYDKKGRPFLVDHREHKLLQIIAVDHSI